MARAGDVAPSVYALLAEYEHAPRIAPGRGGAKAAFHRCRAHEWLSPIVSFDSRRKRTTTWRVTDAGRIALAAWRAQRERDAA